MSILDHLWDDTVAGPRPENGLGKLRKHPTFPTRSISDKESGEGGNVRSYSGDSPEDAMKVTRSIMIMKPAGYQSNGSAPASPAGSTPPVSPFSGKVLSIIKCLIRPWLSGSYVECVLSE
ncbi:dormancy/auxin associated protein [Medicago truncatula]|uniref:Dormancy/auxin associated protein n=1 Tax=Medicago truncatula TaxID=3880 RepID=G7I8R2_MEDTR|nr:dormancy/auxin associated protein [Medicago truncatula]